MSSKKVTSSNSILARAKSEASKFVKRKSGWLCSLERSNPQFHAELVEVMRLWGTNDRELHQLYPNRASLAKFLASLDDCPASVGAIEYTLRSFENGKTVV